MPDWVSQVVSGNLFAPRAGGADLGAVDLDFDDDLGGLKKGGPQKPLPSRAWMAWAAIGMQSLMILAEPVYGIGVLHGGLLYTIGLLILLEPQMAYGRGYP